MKSKGIELAVSTLILLALGVILLIGLVYLVTDGFAKFNSNTQPFVKTSEYAALREACGLSCTTKNYKDFCCTEHDLQGKKILCDDVKLDVSCSEANCKDVVCQ